MKSTEFSPADYDPQGRLRLPFLFWCLLLLQARTWVLFLMAGASRDQGDALLNLFYPDHSLFWIGLLPGVPAVLAFLLSGRRHLYPRLWKWLRPVLILAQLILLLWQPWMWLGGEALSGVGLSLFLLDIFALWWLITNRRLHACFTDVAE
ncbi:DUF2919 domain-containing protein [Kluyvera ascorbata]|uniref:DUF2919 domain-containing protein n=1 Tax=Kluyvera ascorbata TaxID=51288 RepID=UPI0020544D60|nr:DUF2919 domain-containing protein [Kluyvera ascorbata]MEB6388267.1 DUF2919 domain-containing protein [Kluyvera ascorbata]UPQ72975.1 DUF2919 domain-containing protein [Kluyvera ascorbata]HDG1709031.1 DUF2919 domain-containing protein [Kluyvera ascorbata]HED3064800.1 DUF2919 domain-containing protein [Kluyvera ascorbata]